MSEPSRNADYEGRPLEEREAGLATARDALARDDEGIAEYLMASPNADTEARYVRVSRSHLKDLAKTIRRCVADVGWVPEDNDGNSLYDVAEALECAAMSHNGRSGT